VLTRLSYGVYRRSSGLRYRFERRFTRAGVLVFAGTLLAAGLGADLEQALAYQLFSFLFVLLVVSTVCSMFFRGSFRISRSLPRFGSVGDQLVYTVRIENRTAHKQSGLTLLEKLADARMSFSEFSAVTRARTNRSFRRAKFRGRKRAAIKPAAIPSALPGGAATVEVALVPLRRGPLHFSGASIARTDPFGLVRAFVEIRAPDTIIVLPRRYALPPIALPGTLKYQQGGVAFASSVGESEEFVSLREYRRGDPMRHIHWKSWARTGKPIIKEFQDEFFVRHALILDTFGQQQHRELFEEAVSVAASFACTIQTQESLLDLMFVGPQAFCFTAGRGLAHTEQMLEILAAVEMCADKSFTALETLVLQHITGVSGCLCIFIAWDEPRQNLVQMLRALGLPVLVLLIVGEGGGDSLDRGPLNAEPAAFHALEIGKIGEGLQKL
jgi:uncharacterized protein (DUF58 family)